MRMVAAVVPVEPVVGPRPTMDVWENLRERAAVPSGAGGFPHLR